MEVIDLWQKGGGLFKGNQDEFAGVDYVNLTSGHMQDALVYLITSARDGIFNFRLASDTQYMVVAPSAPVAASAFITGEIIGAMSLSFPMMPSLIFYVQARDMFTVSYTRGEWDALSIVAFFDFLHRLKEIAPSADIFPDDENYTYQERLLFMEIWQTYDPSKT